jgi:hypothetical protein
VQARNVLLVAAGVDWTQVFVAVIAAVPATLSALLGYRVLVHLRTPSGTKIGKQVEDTQHVSLSNNFMLQGLRDSSTTARKEAE